MPPACCGTFVPYSREEVNVWSWNRKDRNGGVLDTVAGAVRPARQIWWRVCPHLEMMGSRQLYLEHHTGILAYSDEQIDVNTTGGVLPGPGRRLALMAMTAEELPGSAGTLPPVGVGEVTPC